MVSPSSKAGTWATGAEDADGNAGCLTRVCQGPPSTRAVILCTEMHRNRIAEIFEGERRGCTCGLVYEYRFTTRPAWGQPTSSCGGRRHRLFRPVWPARSSSARLSAPLLRSAPAFPRGTRHTRSRHAWRDASCSDTPRVTVSIRMVHARLLTRNRAPHISLSCHQPRSDRHARARSSVAAVVLCLSPALHFRTFRAQLSALSLESRRPPSVNLGPHCASRC